MIFNSNSKTVKDLIVDISSRAFQINRYLSHNIRKIRYRRQAMLCFHIEKRNIFVPQYSCLAPLELPSKVLGTYPLTSELNSKFGFEIGFGPDFKGRMPTLPRILSCMAALIYALYDYSCSNIEPIDFTWYVVNSHNQLTFYTCRTR